MSDTAGDDLAGGGASDTSTVDDLLKDGRARRWLRAGASVLAAIVIGWLGALVGLIVWELSKDLAKHVTVPVVSLVGALVVAQIALAIALLRSIFTDHGQTKAADKTSPDPVISTSAIEAAKAVLAAAQEVLKGITGPKH